MTAWSKTRYPGLFPVRLLCDRAHIGHRHGARIVAALGIKKATPKATVLLTKEQAKAFLRLAYQARGERYLRGAARKGRENVGSERGSTTGDPRG